MIVLIVTAVGSFEHGLCVHLPVCFLWDFFDPQLRKVLKRILKIKYILKYAHNLGPL